MLSALLPFGAAAAPAPPRDMTAAMPVDPSSPSSHRTIDACRRDLDAARLALAMVAGLLRAEVFTHGHRPISPHVEERMAWARAKLSPLAAASPTVRALLALLDDDALPRSWGDPRWLGRELRRLARRAATMGRCTAITPSSRAARRSPSSG